MKFSNFFVALFFFASFYNGIARADSLIAASQAEQFVKNLLAQYSSQGTYIDYPGNSACQVVFSQSDNLTSLSLGANYFFFPAPNGQMYEEVDGQVTIFSSANKYLSFEVITSGAGDVLKVGVSTGGDVGSVYCEFTKL